MTGGAEIGLKVPAKDQTKKTLTISTRKDLVVQEVGETIGVGVITEAEVTEGTD